MAERDRTSWLRVDEQQRLDHWVTNLIQLVPRGSFQMIALVGSVLERPDYRDVDVRIVVWPEVWEQISNLFGVRHLNYVVTRWGQEQTGLPLDVQFQSMAEADKLADDGRPVNPRRYGIRSEEETDG